MRSLPEIRCPTTATASSSNFQGGTPDVPLGRESGIGPVVLKVLMIQFKGQIANPSYLCQFADQASDGTRLHNPALTLKHMRHRCWNDFPISKRSFPPKPGLGDYIILGACETSHPGGNLRHRSLLDIITHCSCAIPFWRASDPRVQYSASQSYYAEDRILSATQNGVALCSVSIKITIVARIRRADDRSGRLT